MISRCLNILKEYGKGWLIDMKPMRLEYKFLVSNNRLEELREAILPFVSLDEYAVREVDKQYTVRSIYFDTMKLDDYRDKLAGIKIRKKLRIRGYNQLNSESIVFLEIKRKYENHISKNRAPVLFSDLELLLQTSDFDKYLLKKKNYLDARNDAIKFFYLLKLKNCSSVILIDYDREAFYSKLDSTLRITFDKNLRSKALPAINRLFDDDELNYAIPGKFILELKFFGGFPTWLQKIIRRFELNRQALSKYTICVDTQYELRRFVNKKDLLITPLSTFQNTLTQKDYIKNAG